MAALLLLPLALAAQTKPDDSCAISGQVSNAATGEPVRRALVSLTRIDISPAMNRSADAQTVATDAAGQFAITGIAPGKYRLSAERNGSSPPSTARADLARPAPRSPWRRDRNRVTWRCG